ncbi:hypothetical protein [Nocardia thraciensis]
MTAERPFSDTTDRADADRGSIAALEPGVVTDADGNMLWDSDSYSFRGAVVRRR